MNTWSKTLTPAPTCHHGVHDRAESVFTIGRIRSRRRAAGPPGFQAAGGAVIATGWSSNMDFMNINNSLPVRYRLAELERDYGPYEKGDIWADPDIEHAAHCLEQLAHDGDLACALGARAAEDIRQYNSPQAVGKAIRARLAEIDRRRMEST